MNTHIETITPTRAIELLSRNTMNRPLNRHHLAHLANEMKEGRFEATGQSIQIATTGRLLDGQHRLQALVVAGASFPFVVVSDLPEEIFSKIDQGRRRSAGDTLTVAGFAQGSLLSSVVARLIHFENGRTRKIAKGAEGKAHIPVSAILDYCNTHNLERALTDGHTLQHRANFFTRTDWAFLSEVLHRIDAELAPAFLEQLSIGAGLAKNDVVLFVRNRIIRASMEVSNRIPAAVKIEYVWIAWNRVREGRRTGMVKVVAGHPQLPK